jgi:outer membrane protein OmpA-like peptidoglycan-associated protein
MRKIRYSMKTILLLVLFLNATNILAQNREQEKIDQAVSDYGMNLKAEALKVIEEVLTKNPNAERALFVKSNWMLQAENFQEAQDLLEKLESVNPEYNPLQCKLLGECYYRSDNYSSAKKQFEKFLAIPGLSPENYAYCKQMLRNIDFAASNPKDEFRFTFQNIGSNINTSAREYFPSTNADESALYFTRLSKGGEDIYVSQKVNGQWQPSIPIDEPEMEGENSIVSVNSYGNDGAHTIAPSGKFLFFTSCDRIRNFPSCDLYFSKRKGDKWGKPNRIPADVNTKYWESQPCMSADGKTMYFVSSREGGQGGMDIYMTIIRPDGTFSTPINLGETINTPGNEDKPFIHPDGKTLYFASDGHPGYGYRDLFMSVKKDGKWSRPINLGSQINSKGDEASIFVNTLGTRAYISKQNMEDKSQSHDIYSFELPEKYQPAKTTFIKGVVVNAKTNAPLKASVKISNIEDTGSFQSITSDEKYGDFLMTLSVDNNYAFHVIKEGYAFYSQNFSFKESTGENPQEVLIKLMALESGAKFELRNVFFETGKYDLKEESNTELNMVVDLLTKNPNVLMKIAGHTDNVGNAESNMSLSDSRAKSVKEYLVSKGIDPARLQAKGFGATKPIVPNDTDINRAKNRRTEIEII